MEPQKPFACTIPGCELSFTNEDHLNVHIKKHDMALELGAEQKAAFVADQTPTPTRFIRNCEEVGLFQDLQNVNPFDEGFKRAMETKAGALSLEGALAADDVLHTPQMMFPNLAEGGDSALFGGRVRNVAVSRSSSDESGAMKEYETTTISKLTNEVTTISRFKDSASTDDHSGGKETVSYTNNVIQIHSNVEIRKDQGSGDVVKPVALVEVFTDSVIKDTNVVTKDVMLTDSNKLQIPDKLPMMSQKSIDLVVDSLTNGTCNDSIDLEKEKESLMMLKQNLAKRQDSNDERPTRTVIKLNEVLKASSDLKKQKTASASQSNEDYEVIIKLPNHKTIRMKAVEEINDADDRVQIKTETKERLKQALFSKAERVQVKPENPTQVMKRIESVDNCKLVPNIVTLYPVTILNQSQHILLTNTSQKIPIPAFSFKTAEKNNQYSKKTAIKRISNKNQGKTCKVSKTAAENSVEAHPAEGNSQDWTITDVRGHYELREDGTGKSGGKQSMAESASFGDKSTFAKHYLERRSAASRRYRERLKSTMQSQRSENNQLKEQNQRLRAANMALKALLTKHLKHCPCPEDLQTLRDVV